MCCWCSLLLALSFVALVLVVVVMLVVVTHCEQPAQNHCPQATGQPPLIKEQTSSQRSDVKVDVVLVIDVEVVLDRGH